MDNTKQRRVLGAVRSLSEAVSNTPNAAELKSILRKTESKLSEDLSLNDLEQFLSIFTNHNSNYTNVETDEFHTLADEVLNNSIRSLLVYADFSSFFGDAEILSLSMALQYNLSIEAITLNGIDVSDDAISAMCEALLLSRVSYINLSNTPLLDEAGSSIAALAHINPYLRTVIVEDTLISDDVLDEIDVACQFNQSNLEANHGMIDESLIPSADLGRLKQRLKQIIRAHQNRAHFCVAHLFGCCPNGELCFYSHALNTGGVDNDAKVRLSEKITGLFTSDENWEDKLPPQPQAGASWRLPEEAKDSRPKLNLDRRREFKRHEKQSRVAQKGFISYMNLRFGKTFSLTLSAITVSCLLAFFLSQRKRWAFW
ncbi:unnamed protein product [Phytomonas sp. Hart1]|nr:unnamed protein product [Phytomonas sp. Hart1]|eukprot:CCW71152.1 unnamed protein product [Phytomonas sp. isolate Hart1]